MCPYNPGAADPGVNILIVEDDQHLCTILGSVLGNDGHSVMTVSEAGTALDLIAATLPNVLIVNAHLPGVSGLDLARLVRRRPDGGSIAIVVMTAFLDERVTRTCDELRVEQVLAKPFSVLDLAQAIRGFSLRQNPPAREPESASLDIGNVTEIVRLWARHATGILTVDRPPFTAHVQLAGGGPVDGEGMRALTIALSGGDLEFRASDVQGAGDAAGLAELLWTRARAEVLSSDTDANRGALVSRNRLTDSAPELPLPEALARVIPYIGQPATLALLAGDADVQISDVVADLVALANLGLVTLQAQRPAPRVSGRINLPPPPPEAATPVADAGALKRLQREVQLLTDSDPWVVLGIPHDASLDLVQRAGDRMIARYSVFCENANPEIRRHAAVLLDRVQSALAELTSPVLSHVIVSPSEEPFRAGLRAMADGDWTLADRWFSAARDVEMDSPRNLAHLGWVRYHNPDLPLDERVPEGLDLMRLAEQFDPTYAEGQYFLATALHRRGDDDGAMRRLRRALKAQPDHVSANALARKLRKSGVGTT